MTMLGPPVHLWTDREFLDWLAPGVHADLIDGEKHMHSPVSLTHARLVNFLEYLLRRWMEQSCCGGEVFQEVVAVRLSQRNVFLPDLCWFSPEQVPRLLPSHAPIAPTWVCEVLSPRTGDRDLGPKFSAYEEHGVREYWTLDPETLDHRFHFREDDYLVACEPVDGWVASRVIPGFRVKAEWLNPAALPAVADCLAEMAS
jgi:Uma2 family endonuclease